MKRSSMSSLVSPSTAKRQASLAGFLKPKVAEVSPIKKRKIDTFNQNDFTKLEDQKHEVKPIDPPIQKITEDDTHFDTDLKDEDLLEIPIPEIKPEVKKKPAIKPSYRPPPTPNYNHPIVIIPPPSTLILKYNTTPKIIDKPPDLDLLYFTRFIDPSCSTALTKYLLEALPWYRVKYTVRGISINTPRYTTVFGKDSTDQPWDKYPVKPRAIPEILLRLKDMVEEVTGETYNFTLVNYYSSGDDSISYHSDSESFLGSNPCIASMSLGAPRDFTLRHVDYKTNKEPVQKFTLHDGDMVVMKGKTQHKWQHSVPKRKHADGRINITFRKGVVPYATKNYNQYNVGNGPMYRWEGGRMVERK